MVEQGIILVFAVLQIGLIGELITSMVWMASMPLSPVILVTTGVVAVFSAAMIVAALHKNRIDAWPWGIVSLVLAVASMVILKVALPSGWLASTANYDWSVAYSCRIVGFLAAWYRRSIWVPIVIGVGIGGIYLWTGGLTGSQEANFSVISCAIDYPAYAAAGAVFAFFARRVAATADENRARAIELGAQLELKRYQYHVHNATGLLAQLGRSDTPSEMIPHLRKQAAMESNVLRHEILTPHEAVSDAGASSSLGSVVWDACSQFQQLPIDMRTSLGRSVRLSSDEAVALKAALVALLYNVEFHAQANQVVVYAEGDDEHWELTVCDDGVGFDTDRTDWGFGLSRQVTESLAGCGIATAIDSQEGGGTCVTMRAGQPASLLPS